MTVWNLHPVLVVGVFLIDPSVAVCSPCGCSLGTRRLMIYIAATGEVSLKHLYLPPQEDLAFPANHAIKLQHENFLLCSDFPPSNHDSKNRSHFSTTQLSRPHPKHKN